VGPWRQLTWRWSVPGDLPPVTKSTTADKFANKQATARRNPTVCHDLLGIPRRFFLARLLRRRSDERLRRQWGKFPPHVFKDEKQVMAALTALRAELQRLAH